MVKTETTQKVQNILPRKMVFIVKTETTQNSQKVRKVKCLYPNIAKNIDDIDVITSNFLDNFYHIATKHKDVNLYDCSESMKEQECPVCQKLFVYERVMKRHIKNVHEKKKPHACGICAESFAQRGRMKTHKKGKKRQT